MNTSDWLAAGVVLLLGALVLAAAGWAWTGLTLVAFAAGSLCLGAAGTLLKRWRSR